MRLAGLARWLALLSALIALGQWFLFLPLAAMNVDPDALPRVLLLLAFVAWPAAAACAFGAARIVSSRPEVATVLLLFVAASLAYPLFVSGLVPLAAAVLAYLSRPATPAAARRGSAAADAARGVGTGVVIVVALVAMSPFVISLIVLLVREFG